VELTWRGKTLPNNETQTRTQYRLVNRQIYLPQNTELHTLQPSQATPVQGITNAWYNRLVHADRVQALVALLPEFANQVNLIYVDPPFMTGRTFNNGSQITAPTSISYRDVWNNDPDSYLQWLYETFYYLYQLLANNGSLYIHLDWRAAHYAKILLDEIFSAPPATRGGGFKNEIIWHYQSGGRARKTFARKHDTILLYTKSARYSFHSERIGQRRGTAQRNHMRRQVNANGQVSWTIRSNGRLYTYTEDATLSPTDVWIDISHLHQKDPERTGYATQKPEALLERIILASSEEHDIVLDCCCGSGVTPAVAERLGRRWLACDQSEVAINVTSERLCKAQKQHPFALQYVTTIE
jgi:site-specific DNA-methyltransferase (adenine-specific)